MAFVRSDVNSITGYKLDTSKEMNSNKTVHHPAYNDGLIKTSGAIKGVRISPSILNEFFEYDEYINAVNPFDSELYSLKMMRAREHREQIYLRDQKWLKEKNEKLTNLFKRHKSFVGEKDIIEKTQKEIPIEETPNYIPLAPIPTLNDRRIWLEELQRFKRELNQGDNF